MTDFTLDAHGGPLAPPQPVPQAEPRTAAEPCRFTGSTGEYFRIWIVNLFLTIVSLGIYSAWAKVRKKRYLYGNTWIGECNFEFHGRPIAILKGRLIAFAAFAAYTAVTHYSPHAGAALALAMMPAVPWLIVRSFAFNAVNTSFRNVRFGFEGGYREAALAIAPLAIVPLASLVAPELDPARPPTTWSGLWFVFIPPVVLMFVYPYVMGRVKLLQANGSRYGTARFECAATIGGFYVIYILAALLFVLLMLAMGVTAGVLTVWQPVVGMTAAFLVYLVGAALVFAFTRAKVGNLVLNKTRIEGGVALRSTLKVGELARIYAFNLAAILVTLGFAVPWAVMRTTRYRIEHLEVRHAHGLDAFASARPRDVAATGEEMGEMFDLDTRFHRCFVEAGAGPRLLGLHEAINPQAERYLRLYLSAAVDQISTTSAAEHEAMIEGIETAHLDDVQLAVQANWRNGAERLSKVIESVGERGSW